MSIQSLIPPKAVTIIGQYQLTGVMGTASGFNFKADSTFDFFYSYSAINRNGSGTYRAEDSHLMLNSSPRSEKDFNLACSRHNSYESFIIKIIDIDPVMKRYVSCCIVTEDGLIRKKTDELGVAHFPKKKVDSILLIHLLFPDRTSIFKITDSSHNYFEFAVNPSIVNVHFNNLILKMDNDELTGAHPLLEGNQFHYKKK